ncbi:alpha-amylase family glycosyl hydrolase [Anaeromicropila herbilytica]|uniref:Glycogen debranching enzyme n=1 Tax=Anaeromicropila herbilytica TaxID=2785025 RepID=A0A7R7EKS2_9FIRM|nr:alpha-amylase family glycosyl hydrolase [Anaeromicropila herbilytica]BCN30257.1 glycogen debranching enzyme [Anaeromicropila herbilytica]
MEKKIKTQKGIPLPLGVTKVDKFLNFSIALFEKECKLNIYHKEEKTPFFSIQLTNEHKLGNIYSIKVENHDLNQCEYMYEIKGKEIVDPCSILVTGREKWGDDTVTKRNVRGVIYSESFDWEGDRRLLRHYKDMIIYRLHVRGFTNHISSKVHHKGTFLGVIEKIPYLKELGINTIEIMPMYEFEEKISKKRPFDYQSKYINYQYKKNQSYIVSNKEKDSKEKESSFVKLNYWGYTDEANYFSPKVSYSYDKENSIHELKTMIKAMHQNGIEVIMEFYFAKNTNQDLIVACLRYWVLEYHIDGFKLNSDVVPLEYIKNDPLLGETKLFATSWNTNGWDGYEEAPYNRNIAEYNDGFLVDARKLLKGDEEQVEKYMYRIRQNPKKNAVINYITNTNGFTLMDLVSYDIKHNENNLENNTDGTDYNFSWNCGIEGKTRSKKVLKLRIKQIKNALVLLFFSQGTPLILAGDEFGQTQSGNNNAYCQDNNITWLNWKLTETNKEIYSFMKTLIDIRKDHPILHMEDELRVMDYISCGYPDLSYHGTQAWYPDCSNYSRILGVLLCGKYIKIDRTKEDDFFYLAINMHWENHDFDLPKLPMNREWTVLIDTSDSLSELTNQRKCNVQSRSIVVLIGKEIQSKKIISKHSD